MGITFTTGEIKAVCRRLGLSAKRKGGFIWEGVGHDGKYRRTTIHEHSDGEPPRTGTAAAIARQLLFDDLADMKDFSLN
ncbi:MAG: hypothetical protein HPY55_10580 [Firmicutes bacterium]|nr:hypothetical protein [Bacillota bacterium]